MMMPILTSLLFASGASLAQDRPRSLMEEDAVIAANRKGAKPRPVAPGQPLTAEERARARVFTQAKGSVVYIQSATAAVLQDPTTGDVFRIPPGTGTGFVWDELGHVVTNHHVVTADDPSGQPRLEAEFLSVTLADGKRYQARVVGRSLAYDIAVLHVFAPLDDLKPLKVGRSENLVPGQSVLAIGNPFGLDHTLTFGIVSALNREIPTQYGTTVPGAIQTDASINPGNSGGPLMDLSGRLIGMNTSITSTSGSSAGIGFAIPVDTLNRLVPLLIRNGQLERPSLGFALLRPLYASTLGVTQGLVIQEVEPGSLAEKAGFSAWKLKKGSDGTLTVEQAGDILLSFQGIALQNELHLFILMERQGTEKPYTFEVLRNGQRVTLVLDPKGGKARENTVKPSPAATKTDPSQV